MKQRYLDPREAARRRVYRRRRLWLWLALGTACVAAVWALRWIHPIPGACLQALLAGRIGYLMGKEDGNGS